MAQTKKPSAIDSIQNRINEINAILDPANVESLKAELKKAEEAVKFISENPHLLQVYGSAPAKKGKTVGAKKKKEVSKTDGRLKANKKKKAK